LIVAISSDRSVREIKARPTPTPEGERAEALLASNAGRVDLRRAHAGRAIDALALTSS
jgi:hypothetical protein